MQRPETVHLVEDDPSVRDAVALLLSVRGFVTAVFACAEDFLGAIQPDWRGCVIVDIRMPGLSGLALQRRLQELGIVLPVIIITGHGDVAAARQAFLAHAVDFIEKPFEEGQLLDAVERALAIARKAGPVRAEEETTRIPRRAVLSARESEVLSLMVEGVQNRGIADRLGISPRTVEVHKARVMSKLGANSLVDLVRLVDRGGA